MTTIRIGLIGDNIAASRAPDLHHAAARLCGIDVSYERLVPKVLGLTFDGTFAHAQREGFRGLNITYPYKEQVMHFVTIADPAVRAMAACNTMLFDEPPAGFNTDCSGYVAAFACRFPGKRPGAVAMAGCGGVGKAVAFAFAQLGAKSLRLYDADAGKAAALAASLQGLGGGMEVTVAPALAQACDGADGLVNCTPLGMVGYGGNAFEGIALAGRDWVCDVVYTPIETPLLRAAKAAGVDILDGYELYIFQGIHAFKVFTGHHVEEAALRRALALMPARS